MFGFGKEQKDKNSIRQEQYTKLFNTELGLWVLKDLALDLGITRYELPPESEAGLARLDERRKVFFAILRASGLSASFISDELFKNLQNSWETKREEEIRDNASMNYPTTPKEIL